MPEVVFNGPEGRLEGRYQHGKGDNPPIAVVLHPHPQHGGNMNNKVAYTLYHTFVRMDFSVLRFNFRGVGRSQGVYDQGQGELSDAASALDWLQSYNPNARGCWVSGFSFGGWIAMQLLMRRPEIDSFVAVSPPANSYDFSFLAPCPVSGQVIQGSRDEIVPMDSVKKLVEKLSSQRAVEIDYRVIKDADHFFTKDLETLASAVSGYVAPRLTPADEDA
ncbi:MAG: alpha/beta hydrolase [Alphaproteobacteria bacterium]